MKWQLKRLLNVRASPWLFSPNCAWPWCTKRIWGKVFLNAPHDSRLVIRPILWLISYFKCHVKKLHKMASKVRPETWEFPSTKWCQIISKSFYLTSYWAQNQLTNIHRIPTVCMCHDEYTEGEKVAKPQKSLLFSCTDSCTTKKTAFLADM